MAPVATQNHNANANAAAPAHPQHKYATTVRLADTDPAFDNSIAHLVSSATSDAPLNQYGVPYRPENTYAKPNGDRQDYLAKTQGMTALQKHIAYFDADCDGVINMSDTYLGFYAMGFGIILSFAAMLIIHGPFSYPTLPYDGSRWWHYIPDIRQRIYIANIHRCKHGSDSDSYDRRGNFNEEKFGEIIKTYSSAAGRDSLCFSDLWVILKQRRHLMDFFGIFAFIFEWVSTYLLLWPSDGFMKEDDIMGVLDGSIFVVLAARRKAARKGGAFQMSYRKSA